MPVRAALLTCALASLPVSASAYTQSQNPAGVDVALPPGECDVVLEALPAGASFDRATLARAVDEAIAAWSTVSTLPVTLRRAETVRAGRPFITVVDRADAWTSSQRHLALTTVTSYERTGLIVSALLELDDVYHDFGDVEADPDEARHDLASVLTHELGHALGLGHSTDPAAVMFPDIAADDTRARTLAEDDRVGIAVVYGASSGTKADAPGTSAPQATTTSATAPPAAGCTMGGTPEPSSGLSLFAAMLALWRARRRVTSSRACP